MEINLSQIRRGYKKGGQCPWLGSTYTFLVEPHITYCNMAALRQMPPQLTWVIAALAALSSAAPSPSPSPSASPSLGHHVLPAVWGGPVVAGFPVAVPLYAGLESALAAHAQHAFLAAPGALLPGASYGYGYPFNAYGAHAAINIPTASEIYTPHVQTVHTFQAVPVASTVQALPVPVEYGVPKAAVDAAVTEETPKETPAPEPDKSGETSQVGGQAVGIDLGSSSGMGSEGETSGFSAGGSAGQLGGAEISGSGTEAPVTEAVIVETATEVPVVQTTTTPRGAYKLSIAYGVPRAPTISEDTRNGESLKSNNFDSVESGSNQSGPKIQSLDDLISETFSSTAEADSQSSSGSRTGSLDFVDVSNDARTLALSGGLDCTGKGCGTPDVHVFARTGVPTSSGAFRLSLGNGKKTAVSNEFEDAAFGQETVSSQLSAAIPNRAAKQHYYYDLPHLSGVGAAAGGAVSGSSSASASSSSFASGGFSSGQDGSNGGLLESGQNSASSSSFASGGFNSGQGSADGSFLGSGPNSGSSSSFASGGFISPSTSEPHPNYPNSVPLPPRPYSAPVPPRPYSAPVPPKPYSAPVPPYPNSPPPPPYPTYGSPVYSAPAYSPPGGSSNGFAPSQPEFVGGSQGGDLGNGVFTPSVGPQAPVARDEDGVYPPAKPPAPAYGLPQPPPPPAPVDSYGQPIRDLYDIRSGRSISGQSKKQRSSSSRRRFV